MSFQAANLRLHVIQRHVNGDIQRSKKDDFKIRQLKRADLPLVNEMYGDDPNYIYGLKGLQAFFDSKMGEWYVAERAGKIVGYTAAFEASDAIWCGGMLLVDKQSQNLGISNKLLFSVGDQGAYKTKNIVNNIASHIKLSIQARLLYNIISFKMAKIECILNQASLQHVGDPNIHIIRHDEVDFSAIVEYDTTIHTIPRPSLLRQWIGHNEATTYVAMQDGKIVGYGTLFPGRVWLLQPVYAEKPQIALSLLSALGQLVPNEKVTLTVPLCNETACNFVKVHGGKMIAELTRYYTQYEIDLPLDKVFSMANTSTSLC